jgi:hypothetical protein
MKGAVIISYKVWHFLTKKKYDRKSKRLVRQEDRKTERQKDRKTERQKDRKTERQKGRRPERILVLATRLPIPKRKQIPKENFSKKDYKFCF